MVYGSESGGMWYIFIETSFHSNIYYEIFGAQHVLDNWTNCWQRHVVILTYLLVAMATLTSLTTRTLASVSLVMLVTSYTPLALMGMESRSSMDQMVCGYVCVHVCGIVF